VLASSNTFRNAPARIDHLSMPGWQPILGQSLRAAERKLDRARFDGPLLDLTYADTHRFRHPSGLLTSSFVRPAALA
jgi:hypothetical protein